MAHPVRLRGSDRIEPEVDNQMDSVPLRGVFLLPLSAPASLGGNFVNVANP